MPYHASFLALKEMDIGGGVRYDPILILCASVFMLMMGGRLYLAPIGEPADVLDIGTGTGIWAKLFAQDHPNSRVIGTDISIIQPSENMPPNLTFVREDSEDTWIFDHLFDYIHWRMSE